MPLWAWIYVTGGVVSALWMVALDLEVFRHKPWWEKILTLLLITVFWWLALGVCIYEEFDPDPFH